ncbi:MAG: hypothetical protein QM757_31360 [Paludibaculum sp.]
MGILLIFDDMPRYISVLLLSLFVISCRPKVFPPKPPGYFYIDTPSAHEYVVFDKPGFPYTFEYPVYANITIDTMYQQMERHPYWINVNFPGLNGVINITYIDITTRHPLDSLLSDAYQLSFFHHEKAQYIDEYAFGYEKGVSGKTYVVGGNTASRYQFYATDSVKNFMREFLYFDVTPNADSLKPATDFLQKDIDHMLRTLRWKDKSAPVINQQNTF